MRWHLVAEKRHQKIQIMKANGILRITATIVLGLLCQTISTASAIQQLSGHVPPVILKLNLQPSGHLTSTQHLHLAIGLPLNNQQDLTNLLDTIYDPTSTNYHRFLTTAEFTDRFGPTEQDYQTLISFVRSNGLAVKGTHCNRTLLDVEGSVGDIEKLFHVSIKVYRHPTESRNFFAPDVEPSIDLDVPILHIEGLNNYVVPHPVSLQTRPLNEMTTNQPYAGTGQYGEFLGTDLRKAYVPGVSLTGLGQSVGLMEFDGYYSNDVTEYAKSNGLASVNVTNVLIDGFNGIPSTNVDQVIEVSLDIDMVIAMSPGAQVLVYEETNNYGPSSDDLLNRMATDDLAKQLSSSWGFYVDETAVQIFQEFAAQGQAFFGASGDGGAYVPGDASFLPSWTMVGGTVLQTGAGGQWSSETAWSGSGGGITDDPIPSWQTNINMAANHGSSIYRNGPDVAMVAQNLWIVYDNGLSGGSGGTSASAPLWAAFTALANQQAELYGIAGVGSLNPALYAIGAGANYATAFHDITTGNNTNSANPTNYFAVPGYDLCTGLGTPNGSNLINLLAVSSPPTVLFTANPTNGVTPPLTVQFSSPNTNSQGGAIKMWNWAFGDGSSSTFQNPTHTYTNAGIYKPSLTTTNNFGLATVGSGPSIFLYYSTVAFTATPTNGMTPLLTVQFTSPNVDSQNHAITQWNWNFGDGSTSTSQSPSHNYTVAGLFQPTLVATNNLGFADLGYGPSIQVYNGSSQFDFTTNEDAISITGYSGPGGNVFIPANINGFPVTTIGDSAFQSNTNIISVTFPNSVTYIGNWAFTWCSSLTSVTIPASVTNMGYGPFSACGGLMAIIVNANNPDFSSAGGVLFDKRQSILFQCPGGLSGTYIVPDGVTNIAESAFYECFNLHNVTLPDSVTSIGEDAFEYDYNLNRVIIGTGITTIQEYALYGCWNLPGIYFAGEAPNIEEGAFGTVGNYDPATVYYLPGAIGYGSALGGLPTALWTLPNPTILAGSTNLALINNQFRFTVSWATNLSVIVQTSTNLSNPVWTPVITNALSNGIFYFSDSKWTNYHSRFYRISSP